MRQKAKQKINLSNSNWLAAGRLAPAGCWPALQRASAALAPRAAAPGRWPPAARASRRPPATCRSRLAAGHGPPAARRAARAPSTRRARACRRPLVALRRRAPCSALRARDAPPPPLLRARDARWMRDRIVGLLCSCAVCRLGLGLTVGFE